MKVYIGRWDLLPKRWDGINGLREKGETQILMEVIREALVWDNENRDDDTLIGVYTDEEFEETLNDDLNDEFKTSEYWIRIF